MKIYTAKFQQLWGVTKRVITEQEIEQNAKSDVNILITHPKNQNDFFPLKKGHKPKFNSIYKRSIDYLN